MMSLSPHWMPLLATVVCVAIAFVIYWAKMRAPKKDSSNKKHSSKKKSDISTSSSSSSENAVAIIYASQSGSARETAAKLKTQLPQSTLYDAATFDVESLPTHRNVVFVVASYPDGKPPPKAAAFDFAMEDFVNDFRVSADAWATTRFVVFGLGAKSFGSNFNGYAKRLHAQMLKRGAEPIMDPVLADAEYSLTSDLKAFAPKIRSALLGLNGGENGGAVLSTSERRKAKLAKAKVAGEEADLDIEDVAADENPNEMLNPRLRAGLTKQGYSLFGTHSAVKLCRWTKSMVRGRGGCYKHTFYGISSLSCMEMTPSVACANKCVFCWRHHTNPTTREWRWTHESPEFLLETALKNHGKMIKQLRGVPGVTPERIAEAERVRHCALSLVGEPIIYPEINKLMDMMHHQKISTFMVTNAQFPDRIEQLAPVTQLYVSIDAGTKDSLKEIDRPVFEDFWERYLECIKLLKQKRQRTVFRLTLVNNYNVKEIDGYVKLVELGEPDFIEVKGMTYCGDNASSGLTMQNVPFHEEVVEFCRLLVSKLGGEYDIACEHEHSCCMLMARTTFRKDATWYTWINYDKFFELATSGKPFTSMDYAMATPTWAVFGSEEKGFDPKETRHRRKEKGPKGGGC